jgi:hypothetical protein
MTPSPTVQAWGGGALAIAALVGALERNTAAVNASSDAQRALMARFEQRRQERLKERQDELDTEREARTVAELSLQAEQVRLLRDLQARLDAPEE